MVLKNLSGANNAKNTPEKPVLKKSQEVMEVNNVMGTYNKEINQITTKLKNVQDIQKKFAKRVDFLEELLINIKDQPKSVTQHNFEKSLQFLTIILMSIMFDEDKKLIGYYNLLNLFQSYRYGLQNVQEELRRQGCEPSLRVISCIEKLIQCPNENNLKEFLHVYRSCTEKTLTFNWTALYKRKCKIEYFFIFIITIMLYFLYFCMF